MSESCPVRQRPGPLAGLCFVFSFSLSRNEVAGGRAAVRWRRMGFCWWQTGASSGPRSLARSLRGAGGGRGRCANLVLGRERVRSLPQHFAESVGLGSSSNDPFQPHLSEGCASPRFPRSTTPAPPGEPPASRSPIGSSGRLFSIPLLASAKPFCPDASGSG